MEIDILCDEPAWNEAVLEDWTSAVFAVAMGHLGLDPDRFAVSLLATGDTRIAALNAEFRGKPAPTNVLSWPSEEIDLPEGAPPALPDPPPGPPHELGDIAIAHGVCVREAEEQGKPFEHHVKHLLVHALLHLLGYDHDRDADAAIMEETETAILARLGIPDPY